MVYFVSEFCFLQYTIFLFRMQVVSASCVIAVLFRHLRRTGGGGGVDKSIALCWQKASVSVYLYTIVSIWIRREAVVTNCCLR